MIGSQPAHDDEAVNRWLTGCHRDLINGLADTLDLDAGLREIAIAADHHALVSGLSDQLDLDSGLAAILPAPEDLANPTSPQSASGRSSLTTSPTDLVNAIAVSPAAVRLTLRASALNLAQAIDIIRALDQANECVDILMTALAHASDLAYAHGLTHGLTLSLAFTHDLTLDLAHAHALTRAIARAHTHTHDLTLALANVRDRTDAHTNALAHARADAIARTIARAHARIRARAHIHACGLAHDVGTPEPEIDQFENLHAQQLRDVVNDLIGADLHDVDLRGVRLGGVRWSETTRWPTQWIDHIRKNSANLGNGIYEYRSGTSTVDDNLTLISR